MQFSGVEFYWIGMGSVRGENQIKNVSKASKDQEQSHRVNTPDARSVGHMLEGGEGRLSCGWDSEGVH